MARPRRIDRPDVLAAALAVVDDAGSLDALTMAAIAGRLEVTAMALYRHVADKAAVLDGIVEVLLGEVEATYERAVARGGEPFAAVAGAIRTVARRHPAAFGLLMARPASTEAARSLRDRMVAELVGAGATPEGAARVERLVSTMFLGFAVSEASGRFARHARAVVDADHAAMVDAARAVAVAHGAVLSAT